jgi:pimeloyl-ACP methyl ester carboxylesterase
MPTIHSSTRERRVPTNGVELHVVEAGPDDGRPVVLCHGFPELAYSWRHQIPALAEAGYRVLAPDQRGYGDSDRPEPIEAYDIHHLTGDLLGLLDDIDADQAVFVGHDWGSMVVGQMAMLHPERVSGVVAMSVPLLPRGPMAPVTLMRQVLGDSFFYILYFQEPGIADADLGADARETMTRMLAGVRVPSEAPIDLADHAANDGRGFVARLPEIEELPAWLSQEEVDHYVEVFTRTGFTGGINWYRNMDRNWETTPQLDGAHISMPSAFITGRLDPVNLMTPAGVMDGHVLDHRGDTFVEGAGHWVQQEAPDEVNAALLSFLRALDEEGR